MQFGGRSFVVYSLCLVCHETKSYVNKMGFIETYSKARICHYIKHLSILSIPVTIYFKLASHCDVRNVHENQAAFKMNGVIPDFTLCWHNTKRQTHKSLINR